MLDFTQMLIGAVIVVIAGLLDKLIKKKSGQDRNKTSSSSDSGRHEQILKRVSERDADLSAVKAKVNALEIDVTNLRGKMSAKLRDLQKEFNASKAEGDEKDLNDKYVPFG